MLHSLSLPSNSFCCLFSHRFVASLVHRRNFSTSCYTKNDGISYAGIASSLIPSHNVHTARARSHSHPPALSHAHRWFPRIRNHFLKCFPHHSRDLSPAATSETLLLCTHTHISIENANAFYFAFSIKPNRNANFPITKWNNDDSWLTMRSTSKYPFQFFWHCFREFNNSELVRRYQRQWCELSSHSFKFKAKDNVSFPLHITLMLVARCS